MTNNDIFLCSTTTLFVCPFFELLEMKKNVSLLPEKTTTSFFTFLFSLEKNKFAFCLVLNKKKATATFFICLFFFFFEYSFV